MKKAKRLLLPVAMAATLLWSYLVPDAANFQRPELARIFFWHFPSSIVLTGLLFVGAYFSYRVLSTPAGPSRRAWDLRAVSALELGVIHSVVTMVTGIVFSLTQWGKAWQWDPRQTSFLLFMIIYGAYFALRAGIADEEKRESNSGAYMLAALLPMLFLIFVFPRLPAVQQASFHPNETVMQGQLKGAYGFVTILSVTLVSFVSVRLYRLRVRVELALLNHGHLETDRRSATSDSVVRPVRLPKAN
ncbi:hypothetical protein EON81_14425 [bacterium]|nr:MAG: hypothetical protein EON81_14425 [bacterium]